MSEAMRETPYILPERTELKATIGLGAKGAIWFGCFGFPFIFGAQSLMILLALGWFLLGPNWTNGTRVLLGAIGFVFVFVFHILTPPELRLSIGLAWLCSLAGVVFLSVLLGGSRLVVEERGLTVTDFWVPRFRPWSRIELLNGLSQDGKRYFLTMKESKSGKRGLKTWLAGFRNAEQLVDSYGLQQDQLGKLLGSYKSLSMETPT